MDSMWQDNPGGATLALTYLILWENVLNLGLPPTTSLLKYCTSRSRIACDSRKLSSSEEEEEDTLG